MENSEGLVEAEILYSITEICRVCRGRGLQPVISLGMQPLANSLSSNPAVSDASAPLNLVRCEGCGTVQLGVDIEARQMFSNYLWVTGTSSSSVSHCERVTNEALLRASRPPQSVLEVASNDGTLLKSFQLKGLATLGVDPAENLAEIANSQGVSTLANFFSQDFAHNLRSTYNPFDIVIARNVLSHVPDPGDIVQGIATSLSEDGVAVIEFHRADKILEELHYDSIYHEHSLYHSLSSMLHLLEQSGLQAFDLLPSPISGGSWIVFASHESQRREISSILALAVENETHLGIRNQGPWEEFSRRVLQHKDDVLGFLENESVESRNVVAFGASARSSTLLNYWSEKSAVEISAILDSNPLKQGLFSPGLRLPIMSPSEGLRSKPSTVMIMAFNFEEEIRSLLKSFGWRGRIATPLPNKLRVENFS